MAAVISACRTYGVPSSLVEVRGGTGDGAFCLHSLFNRRVLKTGNRTEAKIRIPFHAGIIPVAATSPNRM